MTPIDVKAVTRHDPFVVFDDRAVMLRIYVLVTALSVGLALILELAIGVSPAQVLVLVLPVSVLMLIAISVARAQITLNRNDRDTQQQEEQQQYSELSVPTTARVEEKVGEGSVESISWAPLPPPTMLRDYELALPGVADRIIAFLEQQECHRQALEIRQAEAEIAQAARGQLFAFVLGFVAMTAGFILLWKGRNLAGTIVFITTIASFVGVFIAGKMNQSESELEKDQETIKVSRRIRHNIASEVSKSEPTQKVG